jgi:PKD repeat protein
VATYFPNPGFVGIDHFTFTSYDGAKNSNLATGTVSVVQGPFSIGATTHVPPTYPTGWPVAFAVVPTVTNHAAPVTFEWDFGDGSRRSTNQYSSHTYRAPGNYTWTVICTVSTASTTNTGVATIGNPVQLSITSAGGQVTLIWSNTLADVILETSDGFQSSAPWHWVTNGPIAEANLVSLKLPVAGDSFFRLRRSW